VFDDELFAGVEIPIITTISLTETEILDVTFVGILTFAIVLISLFIGRLTFSEGNA
jgi:hypothetical protein